MRNRLMELREWSIITLRIDRLRGYRTNFFRVSDCVFCIEKGRWWAALYYYFKILLLHQDLFQQILYVLCTHHNDIHLSIWYILISQFLCPHVWCAGPVGHNTNPRSTHTTSRPHRDKCNIFCFDTFSVFSYFPFSRPDPGPGRANITVPICNLLEVFLLHFQGKLLLLSCLLFFQLSFLRH